MTHFVYIPFTYNIGQNMLTFLLKLFRSWCEIFSWIVFDKFLHVVLICTATARKLHVKDFNQVYMKLLLTLR